MVQKNNITIYCDLDGVVCDWNSRVLEVAGYDNKKEIREHLKNGGTLTEKLPEVKELIYSKGSEFWTYMKPFNWAYYMEQRLSNLGNLCFLTSSGKHNKRPKYAAGGAAGKLLWLAQHFPEQSACISNNKYLHAHSKAILIDDNAKKVKDFISSEGHAYHFPNAYKIEDREIEFEEVMGEIEKKISYM